MGLPGNPGPLSAPFTATANALFHSGSCFTEETEATGLSLLLALHPPSSTYSSHIRFSSDNWKNVILYKISPVTVVWVWFHLTLMILFIPGILPELPQSPTLLKATHCIWRLKLSLIRCQRNPSFILKILSSTTRFSPTCSQTLFQGVARTPIPHVHSLTTSLLICAHSVLLPLIAVHCIYCPLVLLPAKLKVPEQRNFCGLVHSHTSTVTGM